MKNNLSRFFLFLTCAIVGVACTHAATQTFPYLDKRGVWMYEAFSIDGKKGNWTQASIWKDRKTPTGELPRVYINGGSTVTVNSPITQTISILYLGTGKPSAPATLIIADGGKLTVAGLWLPSVTGQDSHASVLMQGGELTVKDIGPHRYYFDIGFGATYSGSGRFEIKAGKLRVGYGLRIGSESPNTNTGAFVINGSAPDVSIQSTEGRLIAVNGAGTLEFVLDENGVAKIDCRKSLLTLNSGARIHVDGKQYKGPSKTIVLLEADRIAQKGAPRLETSQFAPPYTADITVENKRIVLKIAK